MMGETQGGNIHHRVPCCSPASWWGCSRAPSGEGCWVSPSLWVSGALSVKFTQGQGLVLLGCVWQEVEEQAEGPRWMRRGWGVLPLCS